MSMKEMFHQLIKEGKSNKTILLDMLEEIKKRNTPSNVIITDAEYAEIKAEIEAMPD